MALLELYLKGKKVIDQEIFLPEYDPKTVPFETRCDLRMRYLNEKVADMYCDYLIPIMRIDYDYFIIFKTRAKDDQEDL